MRSGCGPFGQLEILCMLWLHSHPGAGGGGAVETSFIKYENNFMQINLGTDN